MSDLRPSHFRRNRFATDGSNKFDWLAALETWSKIISAIAIPIVLTVVGTGMQQSVATEGIKKDYVTMAIGILKDEKITDAELRGWALSVVRKNSPVALSDQLQTKIVMGALASIPSGLWFPPTKTIMEPPDKAKAFPLKQWEAGGLTDKELAVGWVESAQIAELNAIKLRGLQQYVRALEKVNNEYKAQRLERSSKKLTEELQKEKEGK